MMKFAPALRPRGWQTHVLKKGRKWLAVPGNRAKDRPHDYWSGKDARYRKALKEGFHHLCGYTAMWAPVGTTDHYIPWARVRNTPQAHQAYQWTNMRYAVDWFNRDRKATPVPDPYTVGDDWFELLLPSLELVATENVPAAELPKVQAALYWLAKHENVMSARAAYWTEYTTHDRSGNPNLSFEALERRAPLIARALRKNTSFLHPQDYSRLLAGTL
jgi:hypothetical protein